MRTTRASNAVLRLKQRTNNAPYSMLSMSDGRMCLTLQRDDKIEKLNEPLELSEFVIFVNSISKLAPKKASKLDIAFEKQLKRKP